MSLLRITLTTQIEIEADTCHVSVVDYPIDTDANIRKAYLYPVAPECYAPFPHTVVESSLIHDGRAAARLPRFRMMALFSSLPLEAHLPEQTNASGDASFLTVIWMQEDPYPFISNRNARKIASIDWLSLASNGNW